MTSPAIPSPKEEGAAVTEPPQMPENAWSELQSIAERLRWLANEPAAKEGMASTVTWRQKLDDAAFLFNVAAAIGTKARRSSSSREEVALEWQPIETAPRDGTDVLVGFARRRPTVGWHNGLGWVSSDSDHELNDPTKWLSLAALSQGE